MKDKIDEIIDSANNITEQHPSYYFKEKVIKAYYVSKVKVEKKMTDWFPWLKPEYQLSFLMLIIIMNVFFVNQATKAISYKNDVASLSKVFNSGSNE
jgi:hypothetical protein